MWRLKPQRGAGCCGRLPRAPGTVPTAVRVVWCCRSGQGQHQCHHRLLPRFQLTRGEAATSVKAYRVQLWLCAAVTQRPPVGARLCYRLRRPAQVGQRTPGAPRSRGASTPAHLPSRRRAVGGGKYVHGSGWIAGSSHRVVHSDSHVTFRCGRNHRFLPVVMYAAVQLAVRVAQQSGASPMVHC